MRAEETSARDQKQPQQGRRTETFSVPEAEQEQQRQQQQQQQTTKFCFVISLMRPLIFFYRFSFVLLHFRLARSEMTVQCPTRRTLGDRVDIPVPSSIISAPRCPLHTQHQQLSFVLFPWFLQRHPHSVFSWELGSMLPKQGVYQCTGPCDPGSVWTVVLYLSSPRRA